MMDARTEPGWYYVGEGRLRYRDEHGWTAFEMDTQDGRAAEWPPATPDEMLAELRAQDAEQSVRIRRPRGVYKLLGRISGRPGRHRTA